MQLCEQDIIQIVERASTITERLGDNFVASKTEGDNKVINQRLQRWCQIVAQGNQEQFEKRLAWDNLDIDKVHAVLGQVNLLNKQVLPNWAQTLKTVLQMIPLKDSQKVDSGEQPVPFEELYLPFIAALYVNLIYLA